MQHKNSMESMQQKNPKFSNFQIFSKIQKNSKFAVFTFKKMKLKFGHR